jgi:putative membrane protein
VNFNIEWSRKSRREIVWVSWIGACKMNTFVPLLIVTAIIGLISGLIIWIVGKLRLGLEINGFGSAFIAGIVIAVIAGIITLLLGLVGIMDGGGLIGGIIHLFISAIVLMISSRILPRLRVEGFAGALVASIAIGAVYWLGGLLLGMVI